MMGEHSTAEALSANKRSTSMATGIPIALNSAHSPSSASMNRNHYTLPISISYFLIFKTFTIFFLKTSICIQKYYNEGDNFKIYRCISRILNGLSMNCLSIIFK